VVGRSVQPLDRSVDVVGALIDGLHVQPTRGDLIMTGSKDDDPAHGERRSIGVVAPPVELAPLDAPIPTAGQQFGAKVWLF